MNFRSFGNDPPPAGGGASGGGRQPGNFPLARQPSVYSLTFDELQSTMGGIGKDFGSMNMDELLKNIWTAEETQTTGPISASFGQESGAPGGAESLQRQGSLTLPRTLSKKKVDQVWRDLERVSGGGGGGGGSSQPQRQRTLGEITLEEFLVKSGVVREDNNTGSFGNFSGFGFQQTNRNNLGLVGNRVHVHEVNQSADFLPLVESGGGMGMMMGLGAGGVSTVAVGCPVSDGVGRSTGGTSSVLPVPYVFKRGRRCTNAVEKVVERRQRRMIKNRESAARSRARKQAYTMELEAEVAKLKEENEEIRKKQAKIFERQKNQVLEMMNMQQGSKRRCLRRARTSPW